MSEDTGTPDSDPNHIDPAGDLADYIESNELNIQLSEDQDPEELQAFIKSVENSDEPSDPGTNAVVRIAREILNNEEGNE